MKYEDIETSIKVNINGAFIVAKEGYEYLKETHGSLILYTSSSYTRGRAMYSVYSATKAAIVNLVQALAEE
jgi:2-C-methyl-D-erythritol 4-phosphate cytidylyltransferase